MLGRCGGVAVGGGGIRAGGRRLQAEQPRLHRLQGLLQHASQERHRWHSRQREGPEDSAARRGGAPLRGSTLPGLLRHEQVILFCILVCAG